MSCVSPILVKTKTGVVNAPCGRCLSCCIAKQSALTFLAQKELELNYKRGQGASFVTLTYDDNHVKFVPDTPYMSLCKRDLQLFFKRLRKNLSNKFEVPIKYIYAGEYGDTLGRPHYHIACIGLTDFQFHQYARDCWQQGLLQIGSLQQGGLRYVIKYMTKNRRDREIEAFYASVGLEKPFIGHSVRLGYDYIINHYKEIVDNGYCFGNPTRLYPKPVRNLVEKLSGVPQAPYVSQYMNNIDTRGESLDNYLARKTYENERNAVLSLRMNGNAILPQKMQRKPVELRDYTNVSYKDIVDQCLYDDVVPF